MALEDAKSQMDIALTRTTWWGYAFNNAVGGATSFLRRIDTKDLTGVDLAIIAAPFDQAVTYRVSTRFGPWAIREASSLMPYDPPHGWPTNPLEIFTLLTTATSPSTIPASRLSRPALRSGAVCRVGKPPPCWSIL